MHPKRGGEYLYMTISSGLSPKYSRLPLRTMRLRLFPGGLSHPILSARSFRSDGIASARALRMLSGVSIPGQSVRKRFPLSLHVVVQPFQISFDKIVESRTHECGAMSVAIYLLRVGRGGDYLRSPSAS